MLVTYFQVILSVVLIVSSINTYAQTDSTNTSIKWQKGFLDIHFIHTGGGNCSFMVFPDGTTMIYDAGDSRQTDRDKAPYFPPFDNREITTGNRIAEYISFFAPYDVIDYAVVGHFHDDHYGEITPASPVSDNGAYKLSGITAVGDEVPIKFLIDRAYPHYNYPFDLRGTDKNPNKTLINYLKFINYHQKHSGMRAEQLIPGVKSQIILLRDTSSFKNFEVRNVKVNQHLWLGKSDKVASFTFNPPLVNEKGYYSENTLSIAFKISYGKFDYFVGGDIPGVNDYPDYDIETPIANILGGVDALTLNHHGYKDASTHFYLNKMNPKVIAHQAEHDPHFTDKVQDNLMKIDADVFTLYMSDKKKGSYKNR